MDGPLKMAPLAGRFLMALIFVLAGIRKLASIGPTTALMASHGIPFANVLVFAAIAVELGGGLMLMAGWQGRGAALVLFVYTLALAVIFHGFWAAPAATQRTEYSFFFGHLSMMGGLLYAVAFGPGPVSVDEGFGVSANRPSKAEFDRGSRIETG
jgi:putative oxidoreductase